MKCPRCEGQGSLAVDIQESADCHICRGKGEVSRVKAIERIKKEIKFGLFVGKKHTPEMKAHLKEMLKDLK